MLTISKKAVTEAESEAILDASYCIEKPFGITTQFINPDDYKATKPFWKSLFSPSPEKQIRLQTFALFKKYHEGPLKPPKHYNIVGQDMEDKIIGAVKTIQEHPESSIMSHCVWSFPLQMNTVIFKPQKDAVKTFLSLGLGLKKSSLPDYPGNDAQHNFLNLWHEIGHGISRSNEAGADEVSAHVCRHAFDDCAFLKVHADFRAVQPVLNYDNAVATEKYSWSCVDALDYVIGLDQPLPWNEIGETGEFAFTTPRENRVESVRKLGQKLHQSAKHAFQNHDLLKLALVTENLIAKGTFEAGEQQTLAQRFALAAKRLSIGTPAYTSPSVTGLTLQEDISPPALPRPEPVRAEYRPSCQAA